MASITLTRGSTSRSIELLDAVNVMIGGKYAELTTDETLAGEAPRLKFSKNGVDYWIREVFAPPVFWSGTMTAGKASYTWRY